jgi:glutamate-5-semialdehyde dehydrogenase
MDSIFEPVKKASESIALLSDEKRSKVLISVADAIEQEIPELLSANAEDLSKMDPANPLYDRLQLTEKRLLDIASDMRHVAALPSPLGRVLDDRTLPNGLKIRKVTVPYGVIGVIYEARPNVTYDVFSLCFKAGSACVLKGGRDANASNRAAAALIKSVLSRQGVSEDSIMMLPPTHEAVRDLLEAVGYVDLVIPRGGRKLIDFVRDNARVPCIETGAGVVNTYFDKDGDLDIGRAIVLNAKTRRVSVCNALDCLIIHSSRLADAYSLIEPLASRNVLIFADAPAFAALYGRYEVLDFSRLASETGVCRFVREISFSGALHSRILWH